MKRRMKVATDIILILIFAALGSISVAVFGILSALERIGDLLAESDDETDD